MSDPVFVSLDEAVPLVHAVIAAIAQECGVRVLFIKGPGLAIQGLREPRTSSDVDVWCDPSQATDLAAALEQHGWHKYLVEDTGPRALKHHAAGYVHSIWPCGVDLHHTFPGFYAPHQQTFDALAERQTTIEVAARLVPTCDVLGSVLVQALHLERNRTSNWYAPDRAYLVEALRTRLDAARLAELADLASATGAADTLAPFLDELGAPAVGRGLTSRTDLDEWGLRTASESTKVILWVEELRRGPIRKWPRILWRGLTYNDRPEADSNHQISTRTRGIQLSLTIRRLWKAARYGPIAVRELVRLRRQR